MNRLADLEVTVSRAHKQRTRLYKKSMKTSRKPQGVLTRVSTEPSPSAAPAPMTSKGLSGLVSKWPSRAASYTRAFTAIDYTIPGLFAPLAQPSSMACWATVYAMLLSWRRQQSLTIEDALAQTGPHWLDLYKRNVGLPGNQHGDFFAAAGLMAEPLQSFSIEGWEQLLRNYGPVIITANENPGKAWAMHARVLTAIKGDGTPEKTFFTIVDPNGGRTYQESIAVFIPKYEDEIRRTGDSRIQVAHWSADARAEVKAQSFGGRAPARRRATALSGGVEIASAIVGAVMTRILDNEGDVSWELDQLQGLKHVNNDSSTAGPAQYQTTVYRVNGPHAWLGGGLDHIYVDTEITFQHNGHSLGNVQISIVTSNDAAGAGLVVKANIMDDANAYTWPGSAERFAAIKVRIHYRFTFTIGGDYIYIDDIVLYGNGRYARTRRLTQG